MQLVKLFSELQLNPLNKVAYRKLADHYQSVGMTNEAEAFRELIKKRYNEDQGKDVDGVNPDQEQRA